MSVTLSDPVHIFPNTIVFYITATEAGVISSLKSPRTHKRVILLNDSDYQITLEEDLLHPPVNQRFDFGGVNYGLEPRRGVELLRMDGDSSWRLLGTDGATTVVANAQIFSGNYGGNTPTDTPTTSAAISYDLDSPFDVWYWNGASWQ